MHYTIDKNKPRLSQVCYAPGHSLGNGWTRHIVELAQGDTSDNPTNDTSLSGPGVIVYDVAPSGAIQAVIYETANDFYKTLAGEPPKEAMQAVVDYIERGCQVVGPNGTSSVEGPVKVIQFWLAGNKD